MTSDSLSLSFPPRLISNSPLSAVTCATVVGLFIHVVNQMDPVSLLQCPLLIWGRGWGEGLWWTLFAWLLTSWWSCRAGCKACICERWKHDHSGEIALSCVSVLCSRDLFTCLTEHVSVKCLFCREILSWLLHTTITLGGYVMSFGWIRLGGVGGAWYVLW